MKKETNMWNFNDINADEAFSFVAQGVWTKDVFKDWLIAKEDEIFMSGVEAGNEQASFYLREEGLNV